MDIGARIKELRSNKDLTQKQLADAMELSLDMVKSLEQGRAKPSVETLERLADFFGCSVDYLLGREEPKEPDHIQITKEQIFDILNDVADEFKIDITDPNNEKLVTYLIRYIVEAMRKDTN